MLASLQHPITVKNVEAIKTIQSRYYDQYEQKSIAQELIQNALNEHQVGKITVSQHLILLQVQNIKEEEVTGIIRKIQEGLLAAQECYHNKAKRIASLDNYQKHLKSHGRGFMTIFYFGWDIVTLKNKDKILIAAIKH